MKKLIETYPAEGLRHLGNPFLTLARSIIGQQISVKAADAIWERFISKCPNISHLEVLELSLEELSSLGLSKSKASYITNIAKAFKNNFMEGFNKLSDDREMVKYLCQIKGIGIWTAEMFLIFYVNHPDILPLSDLGIIKAIEKVYNLKIQKGSLDYQKITNSWKPYRTVATWYLWRSLDPTPIQY